MKYSHRDIDTLARTIFGESRSEPWLGKVAVAYVALNRLLARSWYGDSIEDVCLKRAQFSAWNPDDPNREIMLAVDLGDPVFRECLRAAMAALDGHVVDPTLHATHYHTKAVRPSWSRGHTPVAEIGDHVFFRDID